LANKNSKNKSTLRDNIKKEFGIVSVDWGGIISLGATIVFIIVYIKIFNNSFIDDTFENIKSVNQVNALTILIFFLLGFVSLWLSVRMILLFSKRYFFNLLKKKEEEPNHYFSQNDIFSMLTIVLTTNLIFSIATTLINISSKSPNNDYTQNIKSLIYVLIQGLVIGIITFLPKNAEDKLGNTLHYKVYISITSILIISLILLILLYMNFTNILLSK
jgi:hypothetical protein